MSWIDNIKSIQEDGYSDKCPKCKSENMGFRYDVVESPRGCLIVWCKDCEAKTSISCIIPDEVLQTISLGRTISVPT